VDTLDRSCLASLHPLQAQQCIRCRKRTFTEPGDRLDGQAFGRQSDRAQRNECHGIDELGLTSFIPVADERDKQVSWTSGHGITDLAQPPNAFAGTNVWFYFVNAGAPFSDVRINEFMAANASACSMKMVKHRIGLKSSTRARSP